MTKQSSQLIVTDLAVRAVSVPIAADEGKKTADATADIMLQARLRSC